jgi:hypothetical protein
MGLQIRTIQKLFREDFPGTSPLVAAESEREKLGADLKAKLSRFRELDLQDFSYHRPEEKPRHVLSFSINDPDAYYYRNVSTRFRLILDADNRLTIKEVHDSASALVGDLDEVVRFVQHCKERLDRRNALKAQRGKVRNLLAKAILAQVGKLAKEEGFDFASETDAQKLKLYVKLSDEHAVALQIPFKDFKRLMPELRSMIVTLRRLYENGIRFQIVGQAALSWRTPWITHKNS